MGQLLLFLSFSPVSDYERSEWERKREKWVIKMNRQEVGKGWRLSCNDSLSRTSLFPLFVSPSFFLLFFFFHLFGYFRR